MIANIPAQFAGKKVNLFFDLFDNQNLVASQGWFSSPSLVIVPEPGVASLAILGGLVFSSLRRFLK